MQPQMLKKKNLKIDQRAQVLRDLRLQRRRDAIQMMKMPWKTKRKRKRPLKMTIMLRDWRNQRKRRRKNHNNNNQHQLLQVVALILMICQDWVTPNHPLINLIKSINKQITDQVDQISDLEAVTLGSNSNNLVLITCLAAIIMVLVPMIITMMLISVVDGLIWICLVDHHNQQPLNLHQTLHTHHLRRH